MVKFYGATLEPKLAVVMEICERGSMFHRLQDKTTPLDWELALRWMYEIARGIATLHAWDPVIVHRDLKTLNLLVRAISHFLADQLYR